MLDNKDLPRNADFEAARILRQRANLQRVQVYTPAVGLAKETQHETIFLTHGSSGRAFR
jgi:hypothetical protein